MALESDPNCDEAHYRKGFIHADNGQFELALESYYQAVRIDSANGYYRYALGHVLLRLGNESDALAQFEAAPRFFEKYKSTDRIARAYYEATKDLISELTK
jgi:tetratricopeptide (TPR) repeat protein